MIRAFAARLQPLSFGYPSRRIRILIVDDHSVLRAGLRLMLEEQQNFEVVAEAGTGTAVCDLVREARPDVVVLDLEMPGCDGFETLRRIQAEELDVKVVVLSEEPEPERMIRAIQLGAKAVVAKKAPPRSLVDAIVSVRQGLRWLDPSVQRYIDRAPLDEPRAGDPGDWDELTPREQEIAALVTRGLRYAEIAGRLGISEHTVRNHLRHIFEKLNINSRVELAVMGARKVS